MKRLLYILFIIGNWCFLQAQQLDAVEIDFLASDSLRIFGDLYHQDKSNPTVFLFHQGRSNGRAEYLELIPTLLDKGYNVVSIDQRRGGQLYGRYNRTVAQLMLNGYSYCDTYPDLEGIVNYMTKAGYVGKRVLWGSSYSAALVVRLAHNRPEDFHAVLSFSPASGGPMQDCKADDFFETLKVPLLLMRPGNEMEIESVAAQLLLAKQYGHKTYVVDHGVHGSSMMVASRVDGSILDQWEVVHSFLDEHLSK